MDRSAVSGIAKGISLLASGLALTAQDASEETMHRTLTDIVSLTRMAIDEMIGEGTV